MQIDKEARAIVIETRELLIETAGKSISHYAGRDIDLQSRLSRVDLPKYETSVDIKHLELETQGDSYLCQYIAIW